MDIQSLLAKIEKKNLILFLLFTAFGLVVYSGFYLYELPNPDAIWNGVYFKSDWKWEAGLGRYMIRVFLWMFSNMIHPSVFTIISILILAAICVIITDIFSLEGICALLGGMILIVSPAVVGTLSYYYCGLSYFIAYFFAVLTTWIICKKKTILAAVLGIILLCLSLATYQAYIGIVVIVSLLYLILLFLENNSSGREIVERIVYMMFTVGGGVVAYLVSNTIIQNRWGIGAEESRGFSQMGQIPASQIVQLIRNCYTYSYEYFFSTEMINNTYGMRKLLNGICLLLLVSLLLYRIMKLKGKLPVQLMATGGILLIPIALMSITVVTWGVNIYDTTGSIMLPGMNCIYIFLLCLIKDKKKNIIDFFLGIGSYVSIILIGFSLFILVLSAQTYHKISMNRMDHISKSILNRIDGVVDDSDSYEICIIGQAKNGNFPEQYPELLDSLHWLTASYGTTWGNYFADLECYRNYFQQYCGRLYHRCPIETYYEIVESDFYHEMGVFPDSDSIAVYQDSVIVINLSYVK